MSSVGGSLRSCRYSNCALTRSADPVPDRVPCLLDARARSAPVELARPVDQHAYNIASTAYQVLLSDPVVRSIGDLVDVRHSSHSVIRLPIRRAGERTDAPP